MRRWTPFVAIVALAFLAFRRSIGPVVQEPQFIRVDPSGDGHFGTDRHGHVHEGIDIRANPGENVFAPFAGTVTKIGRPYADDARFDYVEITGARYVVRIMYVAPAVLDGDHVREGQVIGTVQDIVERYGAPMLAHVHVELRTVPGGALLDPALVFNVREPWTV